LLKVPLNPINQSLLPGDSPGAWF